MEARLGVEELEVTLTREETEELDAKGVLCGDDYCVVRTEKNRYQVFKYYDGAYTLHLNVVKD